MMIGITISIASPIILSISSVLTILPFTMANPKNDLAFPLVCGGIPAHGTRKPGSETVRWLGLLIPAIAWER
jgi:hypothetical protein